MKTQRLIEVRAAYTQRAVLNHQCDDVRTCDTIAEAKKYARYCLTQSYADAIESKEPMGYAQVIVNDECVADYFSKAELARINSQRQRDEIEDTIERLEDERHEECIEFIRELNAERQNALAAGLVK